MSRSPTTGVPARSRLRTVFLFVGSLLFLFEEILWVGCMRLFAWLGRLGLLRWLDSKLVLLGPLAALLVLCVPIALLFPVKIAGLWMIASGRFLGGCCVMLAAKVMSTAIIARIFITCRPQLLRIGWFARLHAVTCAMRVRVHAWMASQPAWIDAKRFLRRMRRWWPTGANSRQGTLRRWRSRRRSAAAAGMRAPRDNEI